MTANKNLDFEWQQFCRLGEMIGDGLHHEDPWISKEHKRLAKILLPETPEEKEFKREQRKKRNESIDKQVVEKLLQDRCTCGSELRQTRSGSKKVICISETCGKRYQYKTKK